MPEFLHPLSREEKVAVTGLSPAVYRAMIAQRHAGYTSVTSVNLDTSSKFDIGSLLLKLDVADLERLAASLELTLQADKAAASDMKKAEELYKEAIKINPFDAVAAMSCGVVLAQQGDVKEGLKWLERAHDLASSNARITKNLAAVKSYL